MRIKVAVAQILTYPDVAQSERKIARWIEAAAQVGADVVVFPEACLCGYAYTPAYWATADPAAFQAAEARLTALAAAHDLAMVLGTAHQVDGRWYNSLLVVDKGGVVRGRYAKTHLAEDWSTPGQALPIFEVAGVPACFLVCHDIRYPELVRLPALAGARVCYFCSCESGLLREDKLSAYRAMPISRAAENTIYVVMANTPADPHAMDSPSQSHGNSKIIHPDGNVLDEAGYFEERLVLGEVDTEAATGSMARRALRDETITRAWLAEGVRLVRRGKD